MLGDISGLERIYIVCGYTDMRKSIDGLCAVVEEQLKLDPASSSLFLFHSYLYAMTISLDCFLCVFCKHKLPKNAEALPKSCSGKFLKVAGAI